MKQLKMDGKINFTDNISEADALLVLQSKLKKNLRIQAAARSHGIPVYVTKASSLPQLTKAIRALIADHAEGFKDYESEIKINISEKLDALEEARIAIEQVVIPKGEPVELLPRPSNIILLQKDLIRKYKLRAERDGIQPDVRLRILPFQATGEKHIHDVEGIDADEEFDEFFSPNGETNGSAYIVDRLPLLPD